MKSDIEIYLEQQQKLHELGAYKRIYTFLHPSKKAIVKEVKTVKPPPPPPIKKSFEIKQQEKKSVSLDHMEHLIKKIDQNYATFKEDQTVKKRIKVDLPKTPLTQKLTLAIQEKLGTIVDNKEDLLLTTQPHPNVKKTGIFGVLKEKDRTIIYIEDLNQLQSPENKKLLWKQLLHLTLT
ncbi:MAG: hypothetical protein K940chlam8_00647 [Chlamydiae bacterium]|nr:hypothetical protein [Chlamydiota bacterium]